MPQRSITCGAGDVNSKIDWGGVKVKNAPLTRKERDFAGKNHYLINDYLTRYGLDPDEWYDVVVFSYMLAVQKWFAYPRLHRWSFKTIAFNTMRSAVGNEKNKQKRRIKTVSLYEVIPGTEDMTLMDTITYENLEYKGVYDMDISYNVLLPEKASRAFSGKKSDEVAAIEMFLNMDARKTKNMRFEYKTEAETNKKMSTVRSYINKKNLKEVIEMFRSENCLYIVRKEGKK